MITGAKQQASGTNSRFSIRPINGLMKTVSLALSLETEGPPYVAPRRLVQRRSNVYQAS